jgi:hypothetical protein
VKVVLCVFVFVLQVCENYCQKRMDCVLSLLVGFCELEIAGYE